MAKRALLIVNPTSGKGQVKAELFGMVKLFSDAGYLLEVYMTRGKFDGVRKVCEEGKHFDLILACGGDGTLNEVVTGAMRIHYEGSLGFLPSGTTNDVANSLAIPKNLVRACEMLISTEPQYLDFGSFNRTRYFTYIASFGAFTDVSYSTDQKMKNAFGHAAYMTEAIARLKDLRSYSMKVICDGEEFEDDFLFGAVSNSISIGGVVKLKRDSVNFSDGNHEVLLIRSPKNPADLANLTAEMLSGNFENKSVLFFRGSRIKFICQEEIPWCVDGEYAGSHRQVKIRNLHEKLRVIYP